MKFIFPILMIASFIYLFFPEKEERGILATVLKEQPFQLVPAPEQELNVLTVFSPDQSGQMIETHKISSLAGELIREESFKDGKIYGPQKTYVKGILKKSSYVLGRGRNAAVRIEYDLAGRVIDLHCISGANFSPEHDLYCGFSKPFTLVTFKNNRRIEATWDKGVLLLEKRMAPDGTVTDERTSASGRDERKVYHSNGKIAELYYWENGTDFKLTYTSDGELIEKLTEVRVDDEWVKNYFIYREGKEVAVWETKKKVNHYVFNQKCEYSLKRSMASNPPLPSHCRDR